MIRITEKIALDDAEISEEFIRASGPGGQNVNKVSTAVQLRFDALASPNIPAEVKTRLPGIAGRRLTAKGVLIITARGERSQEANRAEALSKLIEIIQKAAVRPKARVKTKATRSSKERRLKGKLIKGVAKKLRRGVNRTNDE